VGVNYNTLALGRQGYLSMNMVGSLEELPTLKPHVGLLLSNVEFIEGKRYSDFDSTTDKVAAVGLSALIAGAAIKSGLLAKLWAFIIPLVIAGKKLLMLWLAKHAVKGIFKTFASLMGLHDVHLADMDTVAEAAAPFYNNHLRGGEGHMEVGKLILNVAKKKATMTLSVKPFGCMPSAGVSDGVQSIITEKYPEAIYCAIETNGDGAVNVYSRVQMMLFKARLAAKDEYQKTLDEAGVTAEQLKEKLQKSWWKRSALWYPKHGTVAAMSSNVVQAVTGAAPAAH